MVRKWEIKDKQVQRKCIDEILTRIEEQRESEFGMLAAEEIIDIVANYVGPSAYNIAVEDVKKALQIKLADLEVDLDILKTSG